MTSLTNADPKHPGWISLALSVAIRSKDEAKTKALISQIAHSDELEEKQEQIFEAVLEFFDVDDREWFDALRQNIDWNENYLER